MKPEHTIIWSNLSFMGRAITDLNRDELLGVIECLYEERERLKELYLKSQDDKIKMMEDMIKIRFPKP